MNQDSCSFKIDPITYEVVKHSIWQTLWEGRSTMEKVSGSVVVTEAKEVLFSLHQPNGETIVSSAGLLIHISGVEQQIKKIIEWYSENPGIYDGDVFMFNDPYIGGIHVPDQACLAPVYYKGERIGWLSALFHTGEVGAIEPGGMCPSAMEIFHEGIRIPGLKLMEKGVERKDTYVLLQRAVRDPGGITLDCRARVAGLNVGKERILRLFEKYGVADMQGIFAQMITDTEQHARAKLKEFPDGTWRDVTYIDHDGKNYNLAKICTSLTKKGDKLVIDFTGSDPQRPGPTNLVYESIVGIVYTILCTRMFYVEQWNRGVLEVVDIIAPEGTVVNAKWPAPVSMSAFNVLQICSILNSLISRMMVGIPKYYEDQNAGSQANCAVMAWGGPNQYGLVMGTVFFDILSGGQGAGPFDGVDTGCFPVTPEVIAGDVEMYESIMPFLYLAKRQAINSGGAGKYRGGAGVEVMYKVHNTPGVQILLLGWNKKTSGVPGLWGGHQAAPYRNFIAMNTKSDEVLSQGRAITKFEDIPLVGGDQKDYPTMLSATPASQGDVIYLYGVGAGGYGDPLDRDPEMVLSDLTNLIISEDYVKGIYGVVLDADKKKVNKEATSKLRVSLKEKRRERALAGGKTAPKANCAPVEKGLLRIHEYLQVTKDKQIQCLQCGHIFCGNDKNYKEHALKAELKGSEIGSHYLQYDEFVVYHEFYCPGCATQLCQEVLPPGAPVVWDLQVEV